MAQYPGVFLIYVTQQTGITTSLVESVIIVGTDLNRDAAVYSMPKAVPHSFQLIRPLNMLMRACWLIIPTFLTFVS